MSKNRFNTDKLLRFDLGDGDWIEVRETLGWKEFEPLQGLFQTNPNKAVLELLKMVLKKWSFMDNNGKVVEINDDNIANLDLKTMNEIGEIVKPLYFPEKKNWQPSPPGSPEKTAEPSVMMNS